ncbi:MAG TPA: 4Fe-4S cluster-binding domain-containing protein [Burkholderiales bacterium]|nr:4Fe-4S cluster-binding domain-containing protein [Burkholderiales bacterium]
MTTIQLNKAHWPVTVLGRGRRIGLWVQGCSIHCKGCVSQDTWPADPRKAIAVGELIGWCKRVTQGSLDGVTISGGEPFDQPAALAALLRALHAWRCKAALDFDILCYSGYPLKTLQRDHAKTLALVDAVVPEPYADALPLGGIWRGSSNQPLVPLSERGRKRYDEYVNMPAAADKRMQAAVEGGRIWMIGIPARGDMARVEALCASRGLTLESVSWRR